MDVLSDVLRTVKLTGALFFPLHASSPWADEIPAAAVFAPAVLRGAQHVVSYHIVMQGACWATLRDSPPVGLAAGDIFVVPHGDPYVMSSAPGMRSEAPADAVLSFFRDMAAGSAPSVLTEGGGGPERADLVCGFLACDIRPFNPVLETLPRLVHLPRIAAVHDHLRHLIEFALAESRQPRSGAKCVVLRLSEVLFGQPPMRYLAHWRMQLAARLLSDGSAKVAAIAREVGYDSEEAFSRGFKKIVGVAPSTWRRRSTITT
ncbi:MAG: AraC family transcriptional regulator [Vicinamibacterales bacterium]